MRRVLLSLLILIFAVSSLFAVVIEEEVGDYRQYLKVKKNELKDVRAKINAERSKIKKFKSKEKTTTKYLQKIEKDIDLTRKEMEVFENNIAVVEEGLDNIKKRIEQAEFESREKEKVVKKLLRQQYKDKGSEYMKLILGSSDMSQFVKRYKFVKVLSKKNVSAINEYYRLIQQMESDKAALDEYRDELVALKNQKKVENKRFLNEKWKKTVMLRNIRKSISKQKKMINQLEASAKKLSKLMEQIEVTAELSDKSADEAFKKQKGKFPWPVDSRNLYAKFGNSKHPKFKTLMYNRGIHINVKFGSPVYSVFSGVVKYADWFEGYGKMVILYHGAGYFSVYANMSKIQVKKGDKVGIKQVIGRSGDTESFYGSELYFELRKKATPLNPAKYLSRR